MEKEILSFDDFCLNEGIIDNFKIGKETTRVQGACQDEIDKLIQENPKKYTSGQQVLDAIKQKAIKAYEENVSKKFDKAIGAREWWEKYSKANARLLDMTVFGKE